MAKTCKTGPFKRPAHIKIQWGFTMSVDLTNTFRDRVKRQQDNEELLGLQSEAVAGRQLKAGALSRHHKEVAERTRKQQEKSDDIFYVLLDQLQNTIDAAENALRDRYGEDYVNAMANKYGIETDGKTEEELRQELIEELSKDKYKDDKIAQKDLAELRTIEEAENLKLKVNNEAKMGGVSAETLKAGEEFIERSGRTANYEFSTNNSDITLTQAAKDKIAASTLEEHHIPANGLGSLDFGSGS